MQEQKYQAVMAVLTDGTSVSEVAQRWGVSRQSVHAWLRRYEDEGLAGLERRSSQRKQRAPPRSRGGGLLTADRVSHPRRDALRAAGVGTLKKSDFPNA